MSELRETTVAVSLAYYTGVDDPELGVFSSRPVEPENTNELVVGVYLDDDSVGFPSALDGKRLQIELAGSARALEALGTYLIALARLQSADPDTHEHFEDVRDARGGTLHLIVRRTMFKV